MRIITALLLLLHLFTTSLLAQTLNPPCKLQVNVKVSYCIDGGCIYYEAIPVGGEGAHTYKWNTGYSSQTLGYYSPQPACLVVTVTDALGCRAVASPGDYSSNVLFGFLYSGAAVQPGFLLPDTFSVSNGSLSFDISTNDHPLAKGYLLVQQPAHGAVTLDSSGAGAYQPAPGWCGPDYFRYTATDSSGCALGPTTNVVLYPEPCAEVFVTRSACAGLCNGTAAFYEKSALTPPLSFLWSNSATGAVADNLCAGPVAVSVTDGLGMVHVYQADMPSGDISASIDGPAAFCRGEQLQLNSVVSNPSGGVVQYEWSGPGAGSFNMNNPDLKLSLGGSSDTNAILSYRLVARSTSGCADSTFYQVKMYKGINLKSISVQQLPVFAGDTLRLGIAPTGGEPPYSYFWTGPLGIQSNYPALVWPDISAAADGIYRVTVRDLNGCRATQSVNLTVADSCYYNPIIHAPTVPFCKGSDLRLYFGLAGANTWIVPDLVEWAGPGGFYATGIEMVRPNAQPAMSGLYTVTIHLDKTVLHAEKNITVSDYAAQITDINILETATSCVSPYNGKIQVTMSSSPPYNVSTNLGATFPNTNTNPFFIYSLMPYDFYTLKVKTMGCTAERQMAIPYPTPPVVDVSPISCAGHDGVIEVSSGNPLTVSWNSNGPSLPNGPAQSGLGAGEYRLFIKDEATKCQFRDTIRLKDYLSFDVLALDTPDCQSANGALLAVPDAGALPPLGYAWNNQFSGNPAANLSTGWYSVTLTDGAGCKNHQNAFMPASEPCFALLSGRVRINSDCACLPNAADYFLPDVRVCASNGQHTECTYTNYAGYYQLPLVDTGQYTVWVRSFHPYFDGVCDSITIDLPVSAGILPDRDFYVCGPPVTDLKVAVNCGVARPGFEQITSVQVSNSGTLQADSSLITVTLDAGLDVQQIAPLPLDYDPAAGKITWLVVKLGLFEQFKATVRSVVTAALGDTLHVAAEILPKNPDVQPGDNTDACAAVVTGSYDPNDKQVYPPGVGGSGHIAPSDSVLTYTIRFQNTGTDTAFTVIVRDTLDASVFEVEGVQPLQASHPYQLRVEQGSILVFTFDRINLPDSNRTVAGSQGFVRFRIPLKRGLPEGTLVQNSAAIYFDYNFPVITNTTHNTVTAIAEARPVQPGLRIAPNPATRNATAYLDLPVPSHYLQLSMYNLAGQRIRALYRSSAPAGGKMQIPMEWGNIAAGLYVLRLETEYGAATAKLVIVPD